MVMAHTRTDVLVFWSFGPLAEDTSHSLQKKDRVNIYIGELFYRYEGKNNSGDKNNNNKDFKCPVKVSDSFITLTYF
jgi:hypothetical protein